MTGSSILAQKNQTKRSAIVAVVFVCLALLRIKPKHAEKFSMFHESALIFIWLSNFLRRGILLQSWIKNYIHAIIYYYFIGRTKVMIPGTVQWTEDRGTPLLELLVARLS